MHYVMHQIMYVMYQIMFVLHQTICIIHQTMYVIIHQTVFIKVYHVPDNVYQACTRRCSSCARQYYFYHASDNIYHSSDNVYHASHGYCHISMAHASNDRSSNILLQVPIITQLQACTMLRMFCIIFSTLDFIRVRLVYQILIILFSLCTGFHLERKSPGCNRIYRGTPILGVISGGNNLFGAI